MNPDQIFIRLSAIDARLGGIEGQLSTLAGRVQILADEQASSRRVLLDETSGLRHRFDALDRDIAGLTRYVVGQDGEETP